MIQFMRLNLNKSVSPRLFAIWQGYPYSIHYQDFYINIIEIVVSLDH